MRLRSVSIVCCLALLNVCFADVAPPFDGEIDDGGDVISGGGDVDQGMRCNDTTSSI